MAFAKFQENRFRIDGEIAENHAILVNLTASINKFMLLSFCWSNKGAICCVHVALRYQCISEPFNPYSAGIDFRRQNLKSTDVDPRTEKVHTFIMTVDLQHIGIQKNCKELTNTFMMISN